MFAVVFLALSIASLDLADTAQQQDTIILYSDPSTTLGRVGVSSSSGTLYSAPGQGLVDQLNQIIASQGGAFPGQGGAFPGQGGAFPGQGGAFPGQGGAFPGQGGAFPGQGGAFPGQGGAFPGQGGAFPGQGGAFPGQGGAFPGQGGAFPGQGGAFPGQGGAFPGHGGAFPGQGGAFPGQGGAFPGQGGYPGSATCKYWCKNAAGQSFCCETDDQRVIRDPSSRPGFCPPVRPACPPTRLGEPPVSCLVDASCPVYTDKCCYDRCLEQHVCKPIVQF